MNIRKEEAYQHALCMDLNPHSFSCAVVDVSSKKIIDSFQQKIERFEKEHVASFLDQDFFKFDYNALVLSSGSERNTLIPVDIFNNSGAKEIFKLNYREPFDNIDYNRIPELGIVNIYELPLWIKSLFVIKFPRVKMVHRSSVLLKGIFDQPTFPLKVHLFIEEGSFYMMITHKSKLQYFNHMRADAFSDILYHTLFVLEQKMLNPAEAEFHIYGQSEGWEHAAELAKHTGGKVKIDAAPEKGEQFILAKQLLCV